MSMASAEALKIVSLSEAVRERIMRAIAHGDLKPGARLNEAQTPRDDLAAASAALRDDTAYWLADPSLSRSPAP